MDRARRPSRRARAIGRSGQRLDGCSAAVEGPCVCARLPPKSLAVPNSRAVVELWIRARRSSLPGAGTTPSRRCEIDRSLQQCASGSSLATIPCSSRSTESTRRCSAPDASSLARCATSRRACFGDPSLHWLTPREQFLEEYHGAVIDPLFDSSVAIVAPANATILLDDSPVSGPSTPVGSGWTARHVRVTIGHHVVRSGDRSQFGLTLYGSGFFSTYASSAGGAATVLSP